MQELPVYHEFLTQGEGLAECKARVKRFLDLYELVSYNDMYFLDDMALNAEHMGFWDRLSTSESVNKTILDSWIQELKGLGIGEIDDLRDLPQGYPSKLLHTITHVVDGFFGVDSHFFNLIEDSHWVSPGLLALMRKRPHKFWLVSVEVSIAYGPQGFEKKAPRNVDI